MRERNANGNRVKSNEKCVCVRCVVCAHEYDNTMQYNTKHSRRVLANVNKTHFIEREPRQQEFNRIKPK